MFTIFFVHSCTHNSHSDIHYRMHECPGLVDEKMFVVGRVYVCNLVVSSWASLTSSTDGAFNASITVDHVYGLLVRFFQMVNTKVKLWTGSLEVIAAICCWSARVSPSWILMIFHLAGTLLATSSIKSDSSGPLPCPVYFFPKSAYEEEIGNQTAYILWQR